MFNKNSTKLMQEAVLGNLGHTNKLTKKHLTTCHIHIQPHFFIFTHFPVDWTSNYLHSTLLLPSHNSYLEAVKHIPPRTVTHYTLLNAIAPAPLHC